MRGAVLVCLRRLQPRLGSEPCGRAGGRLHHQALDAGPGDRHLARDAHERKRAEELRLRGIDMICCNAIAAAWSLSITRSRTV